MGTLPEWWTLPYPEVTSTEAAAGYIDTIGGALSRRQENGEWVLSTGPQEMIRAATEAELDTFVLGFALAHLICERHGPIARTQPTAQPEAAQAAAAAATAAAGATAMAEDPGTGDAGDGPSAALTLVPPAGDEEAGEDEAGVEEAGVEEAGELTAVGEDLAPAEDVAASETASDEDAAAAESAALWGSRDDEARWGDSTDDGAGPMAAQAGETENAGPDYDLPDRDEAEDRDDEPGPAQARAAAVTAPQSSRRRRRRR
ncbi:MAG: hypothetical protein AB1673_12120 [Actinomycetota bacterium]